MPCLGVGVKPLERESPRLSGGCEVQNNDLGSKLRAGYAGEGHFPGVGVEVEVRPAGLVYFTRVPGAIESPTVTTTRFGASPAASSIPCEVIPRSGRGARFATTTIRLPTRACGSG